MGDVEQVVDAIADIYAAFKRLGQALDVWNAHPRNGHITLGVTAMGQPQPPTDIPADDVPARVDWADKFGGGVPHAKTDTTWSAEDDTGAMTTVVTIDPDVDADSDDETARVVFNASSGIFRVVATTPGAGGTTIRAQTGLYNITPGAPAVGMITLETT